MTQAPALVWFRRDLRLTDNVALTTAIHRCPSILPVFIWAPEEESPWAPGAASQWWLHHSLLALEDALARRGAKLIVRRGPAVEALLSIAAESGAEAVFCNRSYEPRSIERDRMLEGALEARGIAMTACAGDLLFDPGSIRNVSGKPFRVFTAFWKACLSAPSPAKPIPAPGKIACPLAFSGGPLASLAVADLELPPKVDWTSGMRQTWQPGEAGAVKQLRRFLDHALEGYSDDRNRPDHEGTSRLSPHLHFGEISARRIWHAVESRSARIPAGKDGPVGRSYLREIAWREFARHLLFHFPSMPHQPLQSEFRHFPWGRSRQKPKVWKRWTRGDTGYPLVDAGMRQLWHTGWMHNRVRMVVASFLVKHLLIDWRDGADWFWDTLVDADLANNAMGWQWSAGCGVDAAPYFRIFNPVLQGERFDPHGDYVRRWAPELAPLPAAWIHKPWKAPAAVLAEAGIEMGKTYPWPVVAHEEARKRALAAFAGIPRGTAGA